MVYTDMFSFESLGGFYPLNVTEQVRNSVRRSGVQNGIVLVFYRHTTGGIIIIEHEAGFVVDLENALERLAPNSADYMHHLRDYDQNGPAHVRNAFIPPSVTIPVLSGNLELGEYQDILRVLTKHQIRLIS